MKQFVHLLRGAARTGPSSTISEKSSRKARRTRRDPRLMYLYLAILGSVHLDNSDIRISSPQHGRGHARVVIVCDSGRSPPGGTSTQ